MSNSRFYTLVTGTQQNSHQFYLGEEEDKPVEKLYVPPPVEEEESDSSSEDEDAPSPALKQIPVVVPKPKASGRRVLKKKVYKTTAVKS